MTRLWAAGDPITVQTGVLPPAQPGIASPVQFTWHTQVHRISQITREWRVDIDWWRERIWRSYYKLSTESGLLVVIYQDLLTGRWYLQRLFD